MANTTPIVNFDLTRGDDYAADLTFDQLVAGFSEIRFTVREDWATTQTDNTEATLTATLSATGDYTAELSLTNAQTQALTADRYVYDIQVITVSGSKRYTTQRGCLRITPDATR